MVKVCKSTWFPGDVGWKKDNTKTHGRNTTSMSLASHSTDWDERKSVAAGKIPEALTILIYHLVI